MSGNARSDSRWLGLVVLLSVAGCIRWSVPPADEKFLGKILTQTVVNCLCWCVEPYFFSHLLLDQHKDEYLCSFLEAVPRLVIHHLLQSVFRLLLRLVVVVVVVVVAAAAAVAVAVAAAVAAAVLLWLSSSSPLPLPPSSSSSKSCSTSLASAPDSKLVSATRISMMASFWSFFPGHFSAPTMVCLI